MRVTGVSFDTTTAPKVTVGRKVTGVDVLLPIDPAQLPQAGGFTYYQYTPAATWVFRHPLGRIPSVTVYELDGTEMDTDVEASVTTITLTFGTPSTGYIIVN